jgi:hypothetical protein
MDNIQEILVTYNDGGKILYKGNGVRKFIRTVVPQPTPPATQPPKHPEPSVVEAARGYRTTGVSYTVSNSDESPMQAAERMRREAESRGMKFS